MLEVIDKRSCGDSHPVPLLFVHGGWHSASCWHDFLDFFAGAGYRAVAMSLRGHGASPTAKRFHACSMADYVDDVRATADNLGGRPVLIAHSAHTPQSTPWNPARRACKPRPCVPPLSTPGPPRQNHASDHPDVGSRRRGGRLGHPRRGARHGAGLSDGTGIWPQSGLVADGLAEQYVRRGAQHSQ